MLDSATVYITQCICFVMQRGEDFISKVMGCVSGALPGSLVVLLPSAAGNQAEFSTDGYHGVLQFRDDGIMFVVEEPETDELLAWGQSKSLQDALNTILNVISRPKLSRNRRAA